MNVRGLRAHVPGRCACGWGRFWYSEATSLLLTNHIFLHGPVANGPSGAWTNVRRGFTCSHSPHERVATAGRCSVHVLSPARYSVLLQQMLLGRAVEFRELGGDASRNARRCVGDLGVSGRDAHSPGSEASL